MAGSVVRVALLGPGDFGVDQVIAFQRLGAVVIVVNGRGNEGGAAARIADGAEIVNLTDPTALSALLRRLGPDVIVTATGGVAAGALADFAGGDTAVAPSVRTVRLALDREGLRRLAADELGLPTAPFWFASSAAELAAIAEHAGLPMVVKPLISLPGDGQSVLLRPEDVEPAWHRAVAIAGRITHNRVLAETVVEIDHELTLLTLRSDIPGEDELVFCEPIGHRQVDGFAGQTVLESWQPQALSPAALDAARSIAARIVNALGGRGLFGVELLVAGDEVYFSDVNPWPTDAGLVTLRSQRLSLFDLQARAVLGLPLDTIMISPAAAELTYGSGAVTGPALSELATALRAPESDVRVFGGPSGAPRRRLGLTVATAGDVTTARDRVRRATTALHARWRAGTKGR